MSDAGSLTDDVERGLLKNIQRIVGFDSELEARESHEARDFARVEEQLLGHVDAATDRSLGNLVLRVQGGVILLATRDA